MPRELLRRLGLLGPKPATESGGLDELEACLERLPEERARLVASFAGLLLRVAYADEDVSASEADRVSDLVRQYGGLSREEAQAVASMARIRTLEFRGTENHLLTRRFNEVASEEDRLRLIECLYAVATADDLVSHVEDREIRRIGGSLMVPDERIFEIRSRHREKLEELRALRRIRDR